MKKGTIVLMICLIIMGVISYISILRYSLNSYLVAVMPILAILLIVISIMFLRRCFIWYATYMMTGKNIFQPKVDRPRVFIFSIFLPVLLLILITLNTFKGFSFDTDEGMNIILNTFFIFLMISLFLVVLLLLFKTLMKSFESLYLPNIQQIVRSYTTSFTSYARAEELRNVFDGLIKYDFLWYEDLNEQNEMRNRFVEIFVTGNFPAEPLFQLKMDNLQTYVLFENLEKDTKDLSLNGFMKIVKNRNSKASADTITESYRKCVPENIKNRNLIELIFVK